MIEAMSDGHHLKLEFETLEELKREIDRLIELQRKALDRATYAGMTPDQAKEIEARRQQIKSLVDKLVDLKHQELPQQHVGGAAAPLLVPPQAESRTPAAGRRGRVRKG
jgi:hypothetical protein